MHAHATVTTIHGILHNALEWHMQLTNTRHMHTYILAEWLVGRPTCIQTCSQAARPTYRRTYIQTDIPSGRHPDRQHSIHTDIHR